MIFFRFLNLNPQTWCHATTLLKISQLSQQFVKWKQHERECFDELNHRNSSIHLGNQLESRTQANSNPLVIDVPVVPNKVDGIFQETTGALNFTALRKLVQKLRIKSTDPSD